MRIVAMCSVDNDAAAPLLVPGGLGGVQGVCAHGQSFSRVK